MANSHCSACGLRFNVFIVWYRRKFTLQVSLVFWYYCKLWFCFLFVIFSTKSHFRWLHSLDIMTTSYCCPSNDFGSRPIVYAVPARLCSMARFHQLKVLGTLCRLPNQACHWHGDFERAGRPAGSGKPRRRSAGNKRGERSCCCLAEARKGSRHPPFGTRWQGTPAPQPYAMRVVRNMFNSNLSSQSRYVYGFDCWIISMDI